MNVWLGVPFMMVALLGGLQTIPVDQYEAAKVDGASGWQSFWNITLPGLRTVSSTVILLGCIWTFNLFAVIYFVTGGGPAGKTEILVTFTYRAFERGDLAIAATYATIVFSLLLVFSLFYRRHDPRRGVRTTRCSMTRGRTALTHLVLILFVIWSVTPVVWTFLTSLKPESQIFTTQVKLFADPPTLENYQALLTRGDFLRWGANSFFVAFLTTIAGVLLASTCAYALSRFRFRGRGPALVRLPRGPDVPGHHPARAALLDLHVARPAGHAVGAGALVLDLRHPLLHPHAEGLLRHDPLRPRGGRTGGRPGRLRLVLAHRHAALRPGPRRHGVLLVHHSVERVPLRSGLPDEPRRA